MLTTPWDALVCVVAASISDMTAARTASPVSLAPISAWSMSLQSLKTRKVPDLDVVFAAKAVLVDVSGTDPLAPSIRRSVVGAPGQALKIRAGAKYSKYRELAAEQGKEFFPFCIESFGGLGEEALSLLDLVALEGLSLGASARITKSQFRSWLSVDWQRHNAQIVREWSRRVRRKL